MADLILHHFLISPFSEKIRLVMGYKKLAWRSVIVPGVMPKPDVVALTGGYRKTPILQIGADIYCDSALICDVIERLHPEPLLYPIACAGLARTVAQWADSTLFWSVLAPPRDTALMFFGAPVETTSLFGADRDAMKGAMLRLRAPDAAAACRLYFDRLVSMLNGQPFLLGQQPCIADFSVYHGLWFSRQFTPVVAEMLGGFPVLLSWMERMGVLGHGEVMPMFSADAVAVAADAQPLAIGSGPFVDHGFLDEHGIALGARVSVRAESFGPEVSEGELVAASSSHFSLRRLDARAGVVHVHFPRVGYVLEVVG
ncbi:glutathione S-transferase family protein [Glaciimonas sp. GG7]